SIERAGPHVDRATPPPASNRRHRGSPMNLDVVISAAITRFGDRPALFDGRRAVSFRALGERLDRLGTALPGPGRRGGARTASLQQTPIEAIETDLMRARFGYVRTLLNARASADDHAYCIEHCGARVLIFGAEFATHVAGLRARLPDLDLLICVGDAPDWALHYESLVARTPPQPPSWPVEETDLHSIYYTS